MNVTDFDYNLPEELIAQTPLKKRDSSRLLVLDKNNGDIKHETFSNITDYLRSGDVLVLNDTKVIPARLIGVKEETGAVIELLLLKDLGEDTWECLSKPAKRLHVGTIIEFSEDLNNNIFSSFVLTLVLSIFLGVVAKIFCILLHYQSMQMEQMVYSMVTFRCYGSNWLLLLQRIFSSELSLLLLLKLSN